MKRRLYAIEEKMKRKHRSQVQTRKWNDHDMSSLLWKHVLRRALSFRSKILHFSSCGTFFLLAFFRKAFFVLSRIQLLTASELLTFNHETPLQTENQSSRAKLLPSLEIGSQNTSLAMFGIILAHARRPRRKNYVQKKINVSNPASRHAQHGAGGPAVTGRQGGCCRRRFLA